MGTQKSILEYLTAKNPDIQYPEPADRKNTSRNTYFAPKRLTEWTEFSFQTLQVIYEGQLMDKAREKRTTLPDYPFCLPECDCVVSSEPATIHILTKWNQTIVTPALHAIRDTFHPCMWIPRPAHKTSEKGNTTKKKRASSKTASSRLKEADGGAISSWPSDKTEPREMLPKEYKTYTKWDSRRVINKEMFHDDGRWRRGMAKKNSAMPLRQVYTYCVNFGCRYGCILSSGEAFIFRIRPRVPINSLTRKNATSDEIIRQQLIKDGLMEYVSIPWDNNNGGNPDNYKNLTINLGLWLIHVLAGNHYRVGWDYPPLEKETLRTEPHTVNPEPMTPTRTPTSAKAVERPINRKRSRLFNGDSASTKRRRSERLRDTTEYSLSFATDLPFAHQSDSDSSGDSTVEDTEHSSVSETESETVLTGNI